MTCMLLEKLDLPQRCLLGSTIFKKQFLNAGDLSSADKKLISKHIDKVIWQACLRPDTINIRPYKDEIREYGEVEIIEVRLKDISRVQRVAEIIMRTIPYPILLQLTYEDQIMIVVGHSRTSLSDSSRNTIEELLYTDWFKMDDLTNFQQQFFESIDTSKLSFSNFYHFYDDIVDQIILLNVTRWTNRYLLEENAKEVKKVTDQIQLLEQDLNNFQKELKNETQFNRKVGLNVALKHIQEKKAETIQDFMYKGRSG